MSCILTYFLEQRKGLTIYNEGPQRILNYHTSCFTFVCKIYCENVVLFRAVCVCVCVCDDNHFADLQHWHTSKSCISTYYKSEVADTYPKPMENYMITIFVHNGRDRDYSADVQNCTPPHPFSEPHTRPHSHSHHHVHDAHMQLIVPIRNRQHVIAIWPLKSNTASFFQLYFSLDWNLSNGIKVNTKSTLTLSVKERQSLALFHLNSAQ